MKNNFNRESAQALINSFVKILFLHCEKYNLNVRSESKEWILPKIFWIDEDIETVNHHYRGPIQFDAATHYLTCSTLGGFVPLDNVKLEEAMILVFSGNIEKAADQYLKTKLHILPNDPCYQITKHLLEIDMAIISSIYFTSIWIAENAKVPNGTSLGRKEERDHTRDFFRHNIALWLTGIALKEQSQLYALFMNMISSESNTLQNFHTLNTREENTFMALAQCIHWKSDCLELIGALARDHCGQNMSHKNSNMFNFWWNMSISMGDNKLTDTLKSEFQRIVKKFFPKFYFKLPYIQGGPNPACWN